MKSNEAPENVYLALNAFGDIIKDQWQFHRLRDDDIEYTRTDAFIEKAVQYLKDHKEEVETEDNGIVGWISDCFIKDFKNYMKGE